MNAPEWQGNPVQQIDLDKMADTITSTLPDVLAIYLYGSHANGSAGPQSDIDLALLPATPLAFDAKLNLAARLMALSGHDVDLVDLLQAPTVLRAQVISTGKRIYCRDLSAAERFEDYVYSSYARLNEERQGILDDIRQRGSVYG